MADGTELQALLQGYENELGSARVRALRKGGVELLARVEARLGPATRHIDRINRGDLLLVPAVEHEIRRSIGDAYELCAEGGE